MAGNAHGSARRPNSGSSRHGFRGQRSGGSYRGSDDRLQRGDSDRGARGTRSAGSKGKDRFADERPRHREGAGDFRRRREDAPDSGTHSSHRASDRAGSGRGQGRGEDAGRRSFGHGRGPGMRDSRPPQRTRVPEPTLPAEVQASDLEASARRELRGLGRANAENVARHLVMVQRLLDTDPELAYRHARYACSHAGRIAVVREAAAIAAYLSEHYQDALRDLRAARRLSGLDLHRAIEADCERALGNLGRALKAAEGADPRQLDDAEEAEIAMVVSSIRHEMGQTELGLVVIEEAILMFRGDRETLRRLHSVRADRLEELGRTEEARAVRERIGEADKDEPEDVEVYDIEDDYNEELQAQEAAAAGAPAEESQSPEAAEDDIEDDDDADWSADFHTRVEEELAEILEDAGIKEETISATGTDAPTEAAASNNTDEDPQEAQA